MAWKLKIEFQDMFFLVMYQNGHGAVVLLPHDGPSSEPDPRLRHPHSASVAIDDPKYSYGLYRTQITIRDSLNNILWGSPCTPPLPPARGGHLTSANDLFGKFTIPNTKLFKNSAPSDPDVPKSLNARVVLSGGTFSDRSARDRHSRFKWTFPTLGKTLLLSDRLGYEVEMPAGQAHLLIRHHDGNIDEIPLSGVDHTLYFWNRDNRDVGQEPELPPTKYTLTEYDILHELIGKGLNHVPEGDYPDGLHHSGGPITVEEPICGGEQGEPDPPPPDPDVP